MRKHASSAAQWRFVGNARRRWRRYIWNTCWCNMENRSEEERVRPPGEMFGFFWRWLLILDRPSWSGLDHFLIHCVFELLSWTNWAQTFLNSQYNSWRNKKTNKPKTRKQSLNLSVMQRNFHQNKRGKGGWNLGTFTHFSPIIGFRCFLLPSAGLLGETHNKRTRLVITETKIMFLKFRFQSYGCPLNSWRSVIFNRNLTLT